MNGGSKKKVFLKVLYARGSGFPPLDTGYKSKGQKGRGVTGDELLAENTPYYWACNWTVYGFCWFGAEQALFLFLNASLAHLRCHAVAGYFFFFFIAPWPNGGDGNSDMCWIKIIWLAFG